VARQVLDAGAQRDEHRVGAQPLLELAGEPAGGGDRVHGRHHQREAGWQLGRRGAHLAVVGVEVVGGPPRGVELGGDQQPVGVVAVGVAQHGQPAEPGAADLVELVVGEPAVGRPHDQPIVDLLGEGGVDPLDDGAVQRRGRPVAPGPLHVGGVVEPDEAGRGRAETGRPGQDGDRRDGWRHAGRHGARGDGRGDIGRDRAAPLGRGCVGDGLVGDGFVGDGFGGENLVSHHVPSVLVGPAGERGEGRRHHPACDRGGPQGSRARSAGEP
jgi:hypothetical protein